MGQGGIRINMIPKDGGHTFQGQSFGNYTKGPWQAGNLRSNLAGDLQYNPTNSLTNVSVIEKIWDFSTSVGGPIKKDKAWFNVTYRNFGTNKTVADAFVNANPPSVPGVFTKYLADKTQPGVDDGYVWSIAPRVTVQASGKDKLSTYFDDQRKYRPTGASVVLPSPIRRARGTGHAHQLRVRDEVDAHAEQQAAAETGGGVRPGAPRSISRP